ncbi:MAG: hypothetical protein ABII22_02480 [Candidatus Micrarchaeota archaeon]
MKEIPVYIKISEEDEKLIKKIYDYLCEHNPSSKQAIAERFGVMGSRMGQYVRIMLNRGLIEITQKGEDILLYSTNI